MLMSTLELPPYINSNNREIESGTIITQRSPSRCWPVWVFVSRLVGWMIIGGVTGIGFAHMFIQCPIVVFRVEETAALWFTGILAVFGAIPCILGILTCFNRKRFITVFTASATVFLCALLIYGIIFTILEWIISSNDPICGPCYWAGLILGLVTAAVSFIIRIKLIKSTEF